MINRSSEGALVFFGAPSRRQRLARRRMVVIAAICGLALASWALGALSNLGSQPLARGGSYLVSE